MFRYFAKYVKTLFSGFWPLSFPDFTRHFFPSLTETIDSFAKCVFSNKKNREMQYENYAAPLCN